MAVGAIAAAATQLPTVPTLPQTGQIGWTGGAGAVPGGGIPAGDTTAATNTQSFGQTMTQALDSLSGAQAKADNLAIQASTGNLTNVHDYMIAATEASLAPQLTVAVRHNAVEAFNQIMNMGV